MRGNQRVRPHLVLLETVDIPDRGDSPSCRVVEATPEALVALQAQTVRAQERERARRASVLERLGNSRRERAVRRPRGAAWLGRELGVSRQRASVLLNSGRVLGAHRDPETGAWDLSKLILVTIVRGTRGPKPRRHRSK